MKNEFVEPRLDSKGSAPSSETSEEVKHLTKAFEGSAEQTAYLNQLFRDFVKFNYKRTQAEHKIASDNNASASEEPVNKTFIPLFSHYQRANLGEARQLAQ